MGSYVVKCIFFILAWAVTRNCDCINLRVDCKNYQENEKRKHGSEGVVSNG
ncbi:hypothetical protein ACP275_01G105900 [Erythranthe tilingii]